MATEKGFNLIGYATSPMGLGEDLRSFSALLDYLKIKYSIIDLLTDTRGIVKNNFQYLTTENYNVSIFFMSPFECAKLRKINPHLFCDPKLTIGYFLWELPDFPDEYIDTLNTVDHIWCPTKFVQNSLYRNNEKLVLTIPLPVKTYESKNLRLRIKYKIPLDYFIVLYMFDVHSTLARKNPKAVIDTFLRLNTTFPNTHLILKINRWKSLGNQVIDWIPKIPNITLILDNLSPEEIADLYTTSNCYLSLHRSEGFGRTIVEAMSHGLHIVSTNFSGPNDYLTSSNSFLVEWEKKLIEPGEYPYANKSWWGEPKRGDAFQKLIAAYKQSKSGRNEQGKKDFSMFEVPYLANKYKSIIKSYLF